ncbi:hypothetical protein [Intrasporangium flavum]|uniref:hypothetical protein n=1 Tax=Intrasporangium flavum TaxID=1428657 RepID=UPI001A963D44|nr:hypothetical protein [Intrasporangium flavum]
MTQTHRAAVARPSPRGAGPILDRTDWRRGFDLAATGLDCRECGARVGVRPELADRHRRWHAELAGLLAAPLEDAPGGPDRGPAGS